MLVLSRKKDQGILIRGKEGDIRVVVLDAERGRLRLGIQAPGGYTIIREELILETREANRRSVMEGIEGMKDFVEDQSE
ncbi:MAG: carbon storage regulator [Syntrophorhabdales bacterium]|jgi:carbon storage regulator CsrA